MAKSLEDKINDLWYDGEEGWRQLQVDAEEEGDMEEVKHIERMLDTLEDFFKKVIDIVKGD